MGIVTPNEYVHLTEADEPPIGGWLQSWILVKKRLRRQSCRSAGIPPSPNRPASLLSFKARIRTASQPLCGPVDL